MSVNIEVRKIGITELDVDAIVNAANPSLSHGGGVCGAVFRDAGADELSKACSEIGYCKTGKAVITPGFNLKARYIIHAVGPVWSGGENNEENLLYDAYANSLAIAKDNACTSIAFPVISSGIYGYPKREAWKVAVKSCRDFISDNPDYDIEIIFAVLSDGSKRMGDKTISEVMK
ncbi:macro domain-containing protein [Methanobrevibacter sp.]|uniref:macro domain-containing protein n=1 Tax=Methanobrevibacter sp. TaxID=66852 RepID=UPI00388E4A5B